jgi:hypothetical protein
MRRQPAVAGRFYAQDPADLREEVKGHVRDDLKKTPAIGVICPHAGFIYSGDVAGLVYSRIEIPQCVVLLGPNHTGNGRPVSLMTRGTWAMPFGDVEVDEEFASVLLENGKVIEADLGAHAGEHCLETQLPFLQYFRRDFKIVPICLMPVAYAVCEDVARALWQTATRLRRKVLVVASSDMTHYESHAHASKKDHAVIDVILQRDAKAFYEKARKENISMCGVNPVAVLLAYGKLAGSKECELVKYMTSGEVSGDMDQVVGYAGVIMR